MSGYFTAAKNQIGISKTEAQLEKLLNLAESWNLKRSELKQIKRLAMEKKAEIISMPEVGKSLIAKRGNLLHKTGSTIGIIEMVAGNRVFVNGEWMQTAESKLVTVK